MVISRVATCVIVCFLLSVAHCEECTKDGDVRLTGGSSQNEGIVEICFNSTWGFVCDDNWDYEDAKVFCQQYDYVDVVLPDDDMCVYTKYNASEKRFWLDDVDCEGNEDNLLECGHSVIGENNCITREAAGVECLKEILPPSTTTLSPTPTLPSPTTVISTTPVIPSTMTPEPPLCPYEIRLVRDAEKSGLVELCYEGEWGSVCDDYWTDVDANVACRQLGFLGYGAVATKRGRFAGDEEEKYMLDDVQCKGHETSLFDCEHKGLKIHNCNGKERAGVECISKDDIDIRFDSDSETSGYIELSYKNEWRSVCDKFWSNQDSKVACKELGFSPDGARLIIGGAFEGEEVKYWLENVNCEGNEESLFACRHNGIGKHSCREEQRVGVTCEVLSVQDRQRRQDGDGCEDGDNRLIRDGSPEWREDEGSVEICMMNEWNPVCDDGWDMNAAVVVCRKLGMLTETTMPTWRSHFMADPPIHYLLDDIRCNGTEVSLLDCKHGSLGEHNCGQNERAGVMCNGTATLVPQKGMQIVRPYYHGYKLADYAIAANATVQGDGLSGYISFVPLEEDRGMIVVEADISGLSATFVYKWGIYQRNDLINTTCGFDMDNIYDPFNTREKNCNPEKDCNENRERCAVGDYSGRFGELNGSGREVKTENKTGVVLADFIGLSVFVMGGGKTACGTIMPTFECDDGDIRMTVVANKIFMGPIELCIHNVWHRVCDSNWTKYDAKVACKQLELDYTGAVAVYFNTDIYEDTGRRNVTDSFTCTGSEKFTMDCVHNSVSRVKNAQDKVVGAVCMLKIQRSSLLPSCHLSGSC